MPIIKKLAFAPIFLVIMAYMVFLTQGFLNSPYLIFSVDLAVILQLGIFILIILLSGFSFVVFAALAQDWKIVLPVALVAASLVVIFLVPPVSFLVALGVLIALSLTFFLLENRLKSYLTFQPNSLLGPSIRTFVTLVILVITMGYFFAINQNIATNGFHIPDALIDAALRLTNSPETVSQTGQETEQPSLASFGISKEQLDLLKQNPALLKQYGISPQILDSLTKSASNAKGAVASTGEDLIKKAVQDQLQNFIKPYLKLIPYLLTLLVFVTLVSGTSLLMFLTTLLVWLTFLILEKSGFITFTTETREVKKMVV